MSEKAKWARTPTEGDARAPRIGDDDWPVPASAGPHDSDGRASMPVAFRRRADATGPAVVLVAEDDEPLAEGIALLLEEAGYRPIWVANGRLALEAAAEHWPALVIADLMMPLMGGLELIAALRETATARGNRVPRAMLMTAAGVAVRSAQDLGVDAVLRKPFDVAVFQATVRRLLGQPSPD